MFLRLNFCDLTGLAFIAFPLQAFKSIAKLWDHLDQVVNLQRNRLRKETEMKFDTKEIMEP